MADFIVVLDGSRVKESGTHEALLAKGGQYVWFSSDPADVPTDIKHNFTQSRKAFQELILVDWKSER